MEYARSTWPGDISVDTAGLISSQMDNEDHGMAQPASTESRFYPRLSGPEAQQSLSEAQQTPTFFREYAGRTDGHILNPHRTVSPRYCRQDLTFDTEIHPSGIPCLASTDPQVPASGGSRTSLSDPCGNPGVASSTVQADGERLR